MNPANDFGGNQLNYNNDLRAIRNKNYALQKPFKIDFFNACTKCLPFGACKVWRKQRFPVKRVNYNTAHAHIDYRVFMIH